MTPADVFTWSLTLMCSAISLSVGAIFLYAAIKTIFNWARGAKK